MIFSRRIVWPVGILLFLAPAVNLMWRGGTGYCFFALLLLSLAMALVHRRERAYFEPLRTYRWYTLGMLAFIVSVGVQQLVGHYWMPKQFDALSRFALALPIFLMLCQMPARTLRAIGWGCTVGALVLGGWAILNRPAQGWTDAVRLDNAYTNAIPFGDTALLLAFLSVFTFGWSRTRSKTALVIRLLGLVAGGLVSGLSGTRGGWIAVPVFVLLLGAQYRWFAHKKRLGIALAGLVVCATLLFSTQRVQERFVAVATDVSQIDAGNEDTSVGLRLQLWRASLTLFTRHPVYGVGKGRLVGALDGLAQQREASPRIVNERAHSDFFSTLAELGVIGVLCLIALYAGMSVYFWRARHASDPFIRTAAYSGLALAGSSLIYGLTIDVLAPVMVTSLIALFSATFLAAIVARRRECGDESEATRNARRADQASQMEPAKCATRTVQAKAEPGDPSATISA